MKSGKASQKYEGSILLTPLDKSVSLHHLVLLVTLDLLMCLLKAAVFKVLWSKAENEWPSILNVT